MARWVEFLSDFPWHVPEYNGRSTVMYKAGTRRFVKDDCAEKAIARGKAKPCASPRKPALTEGAQRYGVKPASDLAPVMPPPAPQPSENFTGGFVSADNPYVGESVSEFTVPKPDDED